MAKKVFAVLLDHEGRRAASEVARRLKKEYGDDNVHGFAGGVLFVAVPLSTKTGNTAEVAKIKGTDRDTSGAVFKLNSAYSGYTSKSLWEWLADVQES